jgi:transcriptional regulator with XRE-family HTH domain
MRLGVRLKHARLATGYRLRDVAEKVGCSMSIISKIENDKAVPSLTLLHGIVSVLGINIGALFEQDNEEQSVVLRAGTRPTIALDEDGEGPEVVLERVVPHRHGGLLQGNIHIIAPGGGSKGSIQHGGEEVGYVLKGKLELTVAGKTYRLKPGDSFVFRSNLDHSYTNPGNTIARVLWINTPPTF